MFPEAASASSSEGEQYWTCLFLLVYLLHSNSFLERDIYLKFGELSVFIQVVFWLKYQNPTWVMIEASAVSWALWKKYMAKGFWTVLYHTKTFDHVCIPCAPFCRFESVSAHVRIPYTSWRGGGESGLHTSEHSRLWDAYRGWWW